MTRSAKVQSKLCAADVDPSCADVGDVQSLHRGHGSFDAAFQEALRVTSAGLLPREIRVRRNRGSGCYTWSVRY